MRVALINPPTGSEYERHWAGFPVLGLAYVASALRLHGHQVTILDGKLGGMSTEEICRAASTSSFDLVGITCMTVDFPAATKISIEIRRRTDTPIVLGGAHINAVGAAGLEECTAADFLCCGEGEQLIVELANALHAGASVASISGLVWRRGDETVSNPPRPYPADYDELPFPAWDLFASCDQIPILTHRGCPFRCTFCSHNSGFRPRYRSPENVLRELNQVVKTFRPSVIRFEDETFGLNVYRTKRILEGILKHRLHEKVRFSAQTRVDRIDREFVTLLKRCGFDTLELGVESGNPEVLERIKKGITLDQVERAVQLAKSVGLRTWLKFILGHPNESPATLRDTRRLIGRLNPDRLSVSLMTPYPGTPIHEMALQGRGGYRLLTDDWRRFDKYSLGALELEGVTLGALKRQQILCYVLLYLKNRRVGELAALVWRHRALAIEMLVGTTKRTISELRGGTAAQGVSHAP